MDDSAFHAAGDRDHLAGDVARELVRGQDDDLARDVIRLRHLAQGHRPRDASNRGGIDVAARHRALGPARGDRVHARGRRDADDLVLEAEQEPAEHRRLGGRVVGVTRLADDACGRADEHERAVPVPLHLTEEAARGEEGGGQVLAQRLLPALERQLPDRNVIGGPGPSDRGADVDPAERRARLLEEPVDLVLVGQVGLQRRGAVERCRHLARALLATVVVDDDARALRGERTGASCADAAGRSGDEHALAGEAGLHERKPRASNAMKPESPERAGRREAASSVAPMCLHIDAPCVLASHHPTRPDDEASSRQRLVCSRAWLSWPASSSSPQSSSALPDRTPR